MSAPLVLHLRLDAAPLLAALSGLSEIAVRSPELRDGLLGLLDFPGEAADLCRVERTAGAPGQLRLGLRPSDRLCRVIDEAREVR